MRLIDLNSRFLYQLDLLPNYPAQALAISSFKLASKTCFVEITSGETFVSGSVYPIYPTFFAVEKLKPTKLDFGEVTLRISYEGRCFFPKKNFNISHGKKGETQKNIMFQLLIFQGQSLKTQETNRNFAGEIDRL